MTYTYARLTSVWLKYWYAIILTVIIIISFLIRIQFIDYPLLNAHYFRQTQTATVARNFFTDGIDVLHPRIDIAGVGKEQNLILEFPFYQAQVAFLAQFFGYSDSLGRIVSVIWGLLGGYILFLLVDRVTQNKAVAFSSVVFYLFAPLNIFYQQAFMIESTVVTLHILSIYSLLNYIEHHKTVWFITFEFSTILGLLQKSVYAPFLLILLGLIIINKYRMNFFVNKKWLLVLLIPAVICFIWVKYVDYANTLTGQGYFTSGNSGQQLWNFGTLQDRFIWENWRVRFVMMTHNLTKLFFLPLLAGISFLIVQKKKYRFILLVWLSSMIAYYLIFFRIQSHEYYFLIVIPIISIISAYGLVYFSQAVFFRISKKRYKFLAGIFILLFLVIYSTKSLINSIPYFRIDRQMQEGLRIINSGLKEKGYVFFLLPEYDWNSVYTYYTHRKGIAAGFKDVNAEKLEKFRAQGYTYVVVEYPSYLPFMNKPLADYLSALSLKVNKNGHAVYKL